MSLNNNLPKHITQSNIWKDFKNEYGVNKG